MAQEISVTYVDQSGKRIDEIAEKENWTTNDTRLLHVLEDELSEILYGNIEGVSLSTSRFE